MTSVAAIQGWASQLDATMTGLPSAIAAAAPTGQFAAVLASAQSLLDGPSSPSPAPPTNPAPMGSTGAPWAGTATANANNPSGSSVVTEAEKFLGVPYVWGGTSPSGFDCSGLVQYVYGQLGVALPRTSQQQATVGTPVPSLAQAQPGDLVFYAGSDGTTSAPGHVGIYLGNGQIIDAPYTGTNVSIGPVGAPVAIRRVLSPAGAGALSGALSGVLGTPGSAGPTAIPPALAPLFLAAAGKYGIPVSLLGAVAQQESGFAPAAVSSAGAEGIMQLMPSTAASLGVDPFNPAQAVDGAAQLLSGYLQRFQSLPDALAAYNAGAGAVEQYGGVPPFPETQAYVQAILQRLGSLALPASPTAPSLPTPSSPQSPQPTRSVP